MSLDGLRAWIGVVERKLGKRTRVFLALSAIAIGIGGAAIYLAIDARNSSVSESDVQALQERLETRIDELGATAAAPPAGAEAEPAPVPAPEQKPEPESQAGRGEGGNGTAGGVPDDAAGSAADRAKLRKLLERAKERAEEAE